ncbi:hypothetical protein RclHR1_10230006 [Rhizophagus clarus]|uniref:Uncharacterized protein n=1 Tax=Rhizophagus clarus TaxID=94130 RepID=A0A2Z6QT59_9GLOM|nr:hypothetical protein RclHR1_10230006 [Rhizophagus clarus]GES91039.1 hypothetical protein GLOIN_2v1476568 [Rhizophagus clarus]
MPKNWNHVNLLREFVSFDNTVTPETVMDAHVAQAQFRQSKDKIVIEFGTEHDLFNVCSKTVHFGFYSIKGTPRNYSVN